MRKTLTYPYWPLILGMSLFGWLIFSGPAPSAGPKAAALTPPIPIYLPVVAQSVNLRLARVNTYRALAHLPLLTEDPAWSDGAALHARYVVHTGQATPFEDTAQPDFTTEGNAAAANSLIQPNVSASFTDDQAVDVWVRSPFQALSFLDPELRASGFGSFHEGGNAYAMTAVLDVRRGWQPGAPPSVTFPVMWPGNGTTVRLRSYSGHDNPDPLIAPNCAASFQGLPLLLQVGDGSRAVQLAAVAPTRIQANGADVPHCAFSETEYPATPNDNNYGKILLDTRDAIVLIPQPALQAGAVYTISVNALVDASPVNYTWSFNVAADANP